MSSTCSTPTHVYTQDNVTSGPIIPVTLFLQMFLIPSMVTQPQGDLPILIILLGHRRFHTIGPSFLYTFPSVFFFSFKLLASEKPKEAEKASPFSSYGLLDSSFSSYALNICISWGFIFCCLLFYSLLSLYILWVIPSNPEISIAIYALVHLSAFNTACSGYIFQSVLSVSQFWLWLELFFGSC